MFTEQNRVLYITAAAQSAELYPSLAFSAAGERYVCLPPVAEGGYQASLGGTDWLLFLPSDLTEGSLLADPASGQAWTDIDGTVSYLDFRKLAPRKGTELILENTVNAPYEGIKLFGKSEQKAEWRQAEGKTGQSVTEQGKNLFDGVFELGFYTADGKAGSTDYIRSANYIPVQPNTNYFVLTNYPDDTFLWYDTDKNYISSVSDLSNPSPENARYMRFFIYASDLNTEYMICSGAKPTVYEPYIPDSPSPAYPSELTSNIPAGSYQIPAENGIYEVTLTEDLRGIDDTWRDRICFDSVSGTGYLSKRIIEEVFDGENQFVSGIEGRDQTKHRKLYKDMNITPLKGVDKVLCDRFLSIEEKGYANKTGVFMQKLWNAFSFNMPLELVGATTSDTDQAILSKANNWMKENPCTVQYIAAEPVKEPLAFTKVESSSLPVLPWTAYGKQLIPFEPYTTNSTGGTSKSWPAPSFVLGETYYFGGGKCDDGTAVNSNNAAFIILKDGVQLYNKSPNIAITITEDLVGADTVRLYTNSSLAGKTVVQFTGELGSSYSGSYEPFNPTPPEALEVSPDYPQKIYDLSDVTVTSRGRNLFDVNDWYAFLRGYTTTYVSKAVLDGYACIKYQPSITYNKPYMKGCFKENTQYTICFKARQDSVNTGTSSGFIFWYTDGASTRAYVENSTEWKQYKAISTAGKTIDRIEMAYNYGYPIYIIENSVQLLEGVYTAETLPPFDRYRCTEAKVPVTLRSCEEDKDYLQKDGQAIKRYQWIAEYELDGAINRGWLNNYGSASDPRCHYFIKIGNGFDVCKFGTTGKTSHGFQITVLGESYDYMAYLHVPWSVLGFTSVPSVSEANEALAGYCSAQKANGTPVIIQYVLKEPIITDITDTELGQDFLNLKTAQYYTKLSADKETGGLKCLYRTFVPDSGNVTATDYLLTSDGEYVMTNDGKTVIQF